MTVRSRPSSITLVFPHQLFRPHPAMSRRRPVVLVEDSLFFGDRHVPARFHLHKLLLHRATMRVYADELRGDGHDVENVPYDPGRTCVDTIEHLARRGVQEIHLAEPVDYLLERRLRRAAKTTGIRLVVYDTPMFLTPHAEIDVLLGKRPLMARFYEAQRRRLNILMEGDKPRGGRWSFDTENRKRLPRHAQIPTIEMRISPHVRGEDIDLVQRNFPGHPGSTSSFWHPVTRAEAEQRLDEFLTRRFAAFGDYEDAISSRHDMVFHSVITPALNIGLLTPRRVVDLALAHADEHHIPLNSVEGFIRQVIGWREFIRAVYVRDGVAMRNSNFWNHTRPLPRGFYEGTTGLDPVDLVVRRVEKLAWCHHIERLMVLRQRDDVDGHRPARCVSVVHGDVHRCVRLGHGAQCVRHGSLRRRRDVRHEALHLGIQLPAEDERPSAG